MRKTCLAALAAVCACSPGPDRGAHAATLAIDTVPMTDIPSTAADGTVLFGDVGHGTRLADGTVVLADASDLTLRFFHNNGTTARTVGQKGNGPGEFSDITQVCSWGRDSLMVFDGALQRAQLFDTAGRVQQVQRMPPWVKIACGAERLLVAALPMTDFFRPTAQNAGKLNHIPVQLIAGGDTVQLFDSLPAVDPRFGGRNLALAIAGKRAVVGLTDSALAMVFTRGGKAEAPVRVASDPRAQTQAGFERELAFFFDQYPGMAGYREVFRALPHPDIAPAYHELFGSPDGTIWTEVTSPWDSVAVLRAADPAGRVLGQFHWPFMFRVLEIGDRYILAVRENGLGEQRVVVYRIRRTEGGHP